MYEDRPILNIQDIALLKQDPKTYFQQKTTKSYAHTPHLQDLPGDLNSYDGRVLQERYDELKRRIKETRKTGKWKDYVLPKYKELDNQITEETKTLRQDINDWLNPIDEELSLIRDFESWYNTTGYQLETSEKFHFKQSLFYDIKEMKQTVQDIKRNLKMLDNPNSDDSRKYYENWKKDVHNNYLLKQTLGQMEFLQKLNEGKVYSGKWWDASVPMGTPHKPIVNIDNIRNMKRKISDSCFNYDYLTKKIIREHDMFEMEKKNRIRDYRYHMDRIERHCRDYYIPLKKRGT